MRNVDTLTLALFSLALTAAQVGAQAAPYVSTLDPAYLDLDVLVGEGLVRDVLVSERPHSQAAFGRFTAEGIQRAEQRGIPLRRREREALDRLIERFGDDEAPQEAKSARLRTAHSEMTMSSSPARALRPGADGSIDGVVNPLLQVNQGRELADGYTLAAEALLELRWRIVAGQLRPRVWMDVPNDGADAQVDGTLLDAYARGVVGPLGLDIGRGHVVLGYGKHGGPLLSDNARGLDMLRAAMDRPVRLPGPLRVLGLWQASALVADMGDKRDQPGSKLTVMRITGRPSRFIEFGFSYLNIQGGEGAPEASLRERLHDIFFFWSDGGVLTISDKVVGADLGLTLPMLRTQLFVNVLTTDDRGRFQQPAGGLWEDAAWLAGARTFGLGPDGRYDVRAEWRHDGARAHTHHQFTSGLTLDGRVIGDFLGPNAAGIQFGVDRSGPRSVLSLTASWERYSGDDFAWGVIPGGGPWDVDWFLVADNPDEIRNRVTLEWLRPVSRGGGLETFVRVGYEHVSRFDFVGENRSNGLVQLRVGYTW